MFWSYWPFSFGPYILFIYIKILYPPVSFSFSFCCVLCENKIFFFLLLQIKKTKHYFLGNNLTWYVLKGLYIYSVCRRVFTQQKKKWRRKKKLKAQTICCSWGFLKRKVMNIPRAICTIIWVTYTYLLWIDSRLAGCFWYNK